LVGKLTTHVLDTARGLPAVGMSYTLFRLAPDRSKRELVVRGETDRDGRSPVPLISGPSMVPGTYVLEFDVAKYHEETWQLPAASFLGIVSLEFRIADCSGHLHVPLLVSPFGYTTYRGS
jgi:5-hydroxyisourate hydrolase